MRPKKEVRTSAWSALQRKPQGENRAALAMMLVAMHAALLLAWSMVET